MLENLNIFESLTESELQELSLFCQKKTLSAWEPLFALWDAANSLYIVESGWVDVINRDKKIIATVKSGDILWEMAILWGENSRTASAVASSDAVLITILGVSMEKLAETNSEIFEKIQKIISERRQGNIEI